MKKSRSLAALIRGDLLQAVRDPIYIVIFAGPILMALMIRFGVPRLSEWFLQLFAFSLMDYYPFIIAFASQVLPMLVGFFAGFILLDDRDEGLLEYFAVTPLTAKGYLRYRLSQPCLLSIGVVIVFFLICGVAPELIPLLIPAALGISLEGALLVIYLGAFASDKVEGLALGKTFGIILIPPVVGYFAPGIWRWTAAIVPTFWIAESILAGLKNQAYRSLLYALIGAAQFIGLILLFYRRFIRRVSSQ